jgi:hypothetical protein
MKFRNKKFRCGIPVYTRPFRAQVKDVSVPADCIDSRNLAVGMALKLR